MSPRLDGLRSATAAENEEMTAERILQNDPAERILSQHLLSLSREAVEALPHVSDPGRQLDLRSGRNRDHVPRPRISLANASGSKAPLTLSRCPEGNVLSNVDGLSTKACVLEAGLAATNSTGTNWPGSSGAGAKRGSRSHLDTRVASAL